MTTEPTVLVVGGGGTGTGVARDLAMRGVDVALVERGGLSAGTTGRSHGLLHSGARYVPGDEQGARECIAENRVLRDIAAGCVRQTEGMFVQVTGDDPDYFDTKVEGCRELDIPVEVLDGEAAREVVPGLSPETERVATVPDGVIYPSRLTAATAASARDHGATIHVDAPVAAVLRDGERVTGVELESGEHIMAEHVVNATGAWAGQFGDLADVDIEMRPTSGVMVGVEYEGLERVLNRCREPDDGDIVIPHRDQVILGTTSVELDDPDDPPEQPWEVEKMYEECGEMLPSLDPENQTRTYWGVRPLFAPDEDTREARGISRGFFVLDHADRDDRPGLTSVVGGKLTTYRLMAEAVADHVCDRLGVDADCRTAEEALPGSGDPERLDAFVREFAARSPADEDAVSP